MLKVSRFAVFAFLMGADATIAFWTTHAASGGHSAAQIDVDQVPATIGPEFTFTKGHDAEYALLSLYGKEPRRAPG